MKLCLVLLCILLGGCDWPKYDPPKNIDPLAVKYMGPFVTEEYCYDGVVYLMNRGTTAKFDKLTGKVVLCDQ